MEMLAFIIGAVAIFFFFICLKGVSTEEKSLNELMEYLENELKEIEKEKEEAEN